MLNVFTITGTSPATAVAAVLGSPVLGMDKFNEIKIVANLLGATGGALDVYIQWTPDGGTTWYDYAHFTQLGAGAAAVKYTCSSTFGTTVPVATGSGTSPVLAAGASVGGPFGDGLRCYVVAGASTSAGAAQTIKIYGVRK